MKNKEIEKTKEINIEKNKKQKEKKNIFKRIKDKWKKLTKKRKILIVVLSVLLLLFLSLLFYVFVIVDKQQMIVVEKDNFIYENGTLKLLDENQREIGIYECENKDPKLCYVAFEDTDDDFDVEKTEYEDGKLLKLRSKIYDNKYVFIYDNVKENADKLQLYNIKNKKIEDDYFGVKSYIIDEENYLVLRNKDKKSAFYKIEKDLEEIIEFEYDYLGIIENKEDKIIIAQKDKEWMLIDFDNEELSSKFEEEIKNYNEQYIVLKNSNKYRVVEYMSVEVFNDLDYVELEDEIALVVQKNKLNIVDYSNNQLIYEMIELDNSDYVKTIVIDDKNKIVKTKQSFSYEIDKNKITVIIYKDKLEDVKVFNLLEGKNNLKLNYYSYFDGKLYLYSDAKKTREIGEYTCTNENIITNNTSDLSNCYIATDTSTNMTIPMFYNRFIFIYDAPQGASKTDIKVNLYDLRTSKILGNYINVLSDNGSKEFKNIDEDHYVIATNKHNKQGLLKIVTGKVTKAVDFDYDELNKINNINLKGKKDNKYVIVSNTGVEDADAFVGNYYRVKNDKGKYEIYNIDNKRVVNKTYSFAYAELYEKYVVVVTDANRLLVYDYNGNSLFKVEEDPIILSSPTEFKLKTKDNEISIVYKNITAKYDTSKTPWEPIYDDPIGE